MIESPEHALTVGMALGSLIHVGMDVHPEVDDEGNYTDRILLVMQVPYTTKRTRVWLKVEPVTEEPWVSTPSETS